MSRNPCVNGPFGHAVGRDDDRRGRAESRGIARRRQNEVGWRDDGDQVRRERQVRKVGDARTVADRLIARIDEAERTGKAGRHDVAQQRRTGGALTRARADDGE